jgi:hypothetical protein
MKSEQANDAFDAEVWKVLQKCWDFTEADTLELIQRDKNTVYYCERQLKASGSEQVQKQRVIVKARATGDKGLD